MAFAIFVHVFSLILQYTHHTQSVLKHRTKKWIVYFILLEMFLVIPCSFAFSSSQLVYPVGIKNIARWCHCIEFPHLFFFFLMMGCSFIIRICLSLIFYNHISHSNNRGLKNFAIKTWIMRPCEAKSRNDLSRVRSRIPTRPCGDCNFRFYVFMFLFWMHTFLATMLQTKSYQVKHCSY